jgi:hypothetical protein
MIIAKLSLRNWRNFRQADVRLADRVFVVGPNASGKSNFLDAIRFLRDIAKTGGGLQPAIGTRGGLSKMRCLAARKHPNLVFHIAVREIEAWLLADARNLPRFLGCPPKGVPDNPESLADPKAFLIDLARRSRFREIRDRVAPRPGSTAQQGPDYNACLGEFVATSWDVTEAQKRSRSLRQAVRRIRDFLPVWD